MFILFNSLCAKLFSVLDKITSANTVLVVIYTIGWAIPHKSSPQIIYIYSYFIL